MAERPTLRGERVVLRAPRPSDRADRLEWGRHPELVRLNGGDPRNLTRLLAEEVDRWYDVWTIVWFDASNSIRYTQLADRDGIGSVSLPWCGRPDLV